MSFGEEPGAHILCPVVSKVTLNILSSKDGGSSAKTRLGVRLIATISVRAINTNTRPTRHILLLDFFISFTSTAYSI
jgi:hypothetical protein